MSKATIRTLVVGGAGFIGTHLVRLLCADGKRQVVVLGRRQKVGDLLPAEVCYVSSGVEDVCVLSDLLDDADEVIDLAYATVPKTSFDNPVNDVLSNLPATVNLLQKASAHKLRRFLLVSSGGTVYGNAQKLPIDENHPTDPISPYGITKLALEKYALMFQCLTALPVVIVRPGNPYGQNQFGNLTQGFIGVAMHSVVRRQPITIFGESGTVRDYIHVDDLCRGILAALEYGVPGDVFNVGTGIGHDNRDVLDLLSKIVSHCGYSVEIKILPSRSFDVTSNVLSSARLTYASGWRADIALEDGLRQTWDWVCELEGEM